MSVKITWRNGAAYARGTVSGQRVYQSLGTRDEAQAIQAVAQLEADLWKQSVYGADAVVTFDQAAASYAEGGGETRFLLRVMKHFKGVKLGSIKPGHVIDAAKKLYPKAKPATQRRQVIVPCAAV